MTEYADQRGHDVMWMTAEERNAIDIKGDGELRPGQIWKDDTGYLYRITFVDPADENYVWARHPSAKATSNRQVHRSWFKSPGWQMTSEAPAL